MDNTFTKRIFFSFLFIFLAVASFAQTITVGTVDPGPYGRGSSIAVPITINDAGGCMQIGNTYTLYLSDASGNFSPGTAIGTANNFYTPFVNGVIPAGTPAGTGYKVQVRSNNPVKISSTSAAFEIKATTGVVASASCDQNVATDVFGSCVGADGVPFSISSTSPAGNTTTASFNNEMTQTPSGSATLPSSGPGYTFTANATNYTVSVKSVDASGIIGTRDYELINNYPRSNIGSTGNGFTCLDNNQGPLSFSIDVSSASGGIQVNYPGNLYRLDWGDGTSTTYTFCQLKAANGLVTHIFTLPSCGSQGNSQDNLANAFKVTTDISNPYCGSATFSPKFTTARVLIKPKVSFTGPTVACVGTQITLTNTSSPGPAPMNFTSPTCLDNPGALYDWYLDGTKYANYTLTQPFVLPTNLAHGTHTIILHAQPQAGSAGCVAADVTQTICLENPPQPAFTIPAAVCQSATVPVLPTDASVIDATCAVSPTNSTHTYTWTVTGPAAVGYAGGTNANSTIPKFIFNTPGTYTVQLGISTSGCGQVLSTPQDIYVDDAATVNLSPNVTLCNTNQTLTFDNTAGSQTKTTFAGTTKPGASNFNWTVTGGTYSFAGGTTATSQYPQILFTGLGTYTVTATHTNSCNTATATQKITFIVPPTVNAGPDQTICSTGSATLEGSVTGTYTSYAWTGGTGTFSPGRNALAPSYTPSAAEITAGTVTLTLHGYNAGVASPCADVGDPMVITITPLVKVNSNNTASVCSGSALSYTITADHTPATFTWTASATTGSPTGFTTSGTSSSITDVLVNAGTTNAVVTYKITPTYNGCPGPVFTLNVTVNPLPTITATSPTICNVQQANIALTSTVSGTSYKWTSVAQAGVTGNTQQSSKVTVTSIADILTNSSVTTAKTVTYTITPYNGNCAGTPITATVTVQPSVPSIPGADREICGTTYTLEGNNPAPATGKWTIASGAPGVVITDDTNPTSTVTGLVAGQVYKFTWTVSNLPTCVDAKTVTITVDTPPTAGTAIATPSTVCKGSSSFIKLSGYYGSITKWQSSVDGGTTWTDISNINDSYTTLALTQTTVFRAVMHSGVCADVYPTATVTVVPPPVTSVPGSDVVLCGIPPAGFSTLSYTLGANSPGTGTGKWTMVSGPGPVQFDDDTKPNAVASNLVPGGTYVLSWTISGVSGTPCPPSSNQLTITVEKPPVGGSTNTNPSTVCYGSNGTIYLAGYFGNVAKWQSSTNGGTTWTDINFVADAYPYSNLTTTTTFRAWVHNGTQCPDVPSDPVTVTVAPAIVPSNPGADAVICGTVTTANPIISYTLQGNNPSPGTGKWTIKSGPTSAQFVDNTSPTTVVTNLQAGSVYEFQWTISGVAGSPCAPDGKAVTITVEKPPVGGITSTNPSTVCTGASGNITLSGQFGTITKWQSSIDGGTTWTDISFIGDTYPYTNLTTTTTFRAVIHNGTQCPDAYSGETTVTVNPATVLANAGPNEEVCSITSYTLKGNDPSPGNGKWTLTSGQPGITFDNDTDPHATASGLLPGNVYTFQWTINGLPGCTMNNSSVTITVDEGPVGGLALGTTDICGGTTNGGIITLSGQSGTVVGWQKSIDNGNTWTAISSVADTYTYTNLTQSTQFRAILHKAGLCGDVPSAPAIITIGTPPVTSAPGPDKVLCNVASYTLQGNSPGAGTGKWTIDAGPSAGVTFSSDTDPHATVSGLTAGNTYTFRWTITGTPPCNPSSNVVKITIDKLPVGGNTIGSATVCTGDNHGSITLGGQVGTVDHWEFTTDGGTTWQTIASTNTVIPYDLLTQTTTFRAIVQSGSCGTAVSTPSTITVGQPAVASVPGPNASICNATTYTLQANSPAPGTGKWTIDAGPTAGVTFSDDTKANATVSGLVAGNIYTFRWTITGSAGCSTTTNTVTITVDELSLGGTTAGAKVFCEGPNAGQVTLSGQRGIIDHWEMSEDNGANWTSIANTNTTQAYSGLTTTTRYRAMVRNGTCPPVASTPTTITINPLTVVATAGANQELCSVSTYTLQGNDPGTGTGKWTVDAGPPAVTFVDDTKFNTAVNGLIAGNTYTFHWTITGLAPCAPTTSAVTIIIDKPSYGGTTAGSKAFCDGPNAGQITLSNQVGVIDYWESSVDNGAHWVTISSSSSTLPYASLTETTQYRAVVHNGVCAPDFSTISTITINPLTTIAVAGPNKELCSVTSYTMQGNDPGTNNTGLWTVDGAPAGVTFADATKYNTIVNGLVAGNTYNFHWTITGVAPCGPTSSPVTIIVDKASYGGTTAGSTAYCTGPNVGQINLSNQVGTVDKWQKSIDNGATWIDIPNTGNAYQYSNLTQTTQFRAMVHNGVCGQDPSSVSTITINPPTTVAVAGPNQELCATSTYTMQGNAPGTNNTGLWTVDGSPAGVTFTDATKYNTDVNGMVAGNTYTFHWTITGVAPCDPSSSAVTLVIDKPSYGGTTAGTAVFCTGPNGGQITLSGQVGSVDYWQKSLDNGATWTNIPNTTTVQTYSGLTQTTQYRAMVHNGVCGQDPSSASTITINPPTVTAVAGPNKELCSVTSYTMQGNDPGTTGSTGLWTVDAGVPPVTFVDPTKYNTVVNNLVAGNTYTFHWTITGAAPCLPSSSPVTIIIDQPSVGGVTAGSDTYCAGVPNFGQITLTGQTGTIDYWQKSVDNGVTWTNITNTTATMPYSAVTQTTQYRAMVHNGVCGQDPSSVSTITINPVTTTAVAGPDKELCSVTTYTMQGNDPGANNTGLWTVDGSPAGVTFTDATKYNTDVNGLVAGTTYTFRWTITGLAPCPPTSSSMTLIIDKPSVGGTTAGSVVLCTGPNSGQITLSGQTGTVDFWQKSVDNGANWTNIANTSLALPYSNVTQTTQFRAMVHNGVCGQDPSTVSTVTINPLTTVAVAGPNKELCSATTYTMQGNNPGTNNTGLWTVDGSPAGVTFTDATKYNTDVNGLVAGNTYTFHWTITGLAPCDPTTSSMTLIIDKPSVGGTTDGTAVFCTGPNSGQVTLSGQTGTVDYWQKSVDNGATWINIANTDVAQPYSNLTQTTQFRAMVHNGVCGQDPSSATTITINPLTTAAVAGPNKELCSVTTYTMQGNNPGTNNTGLWTVDGSPAGVTFTDPTKYDTQVNGLVAGTTYTFHWTITGLAPCDPTTSSMTLIIDKPSVGGTTDGSMVLCTGPNSGVITLSGQTGTVDFWQKSVDNGTTWTNIANTDVALPYSNVTQTTQFRAMVHNGVCGQDPSSASTITINPLTTVAVAGANQELCSVTTYTMQGNDPGVNNTGLWTVDGSPAGVTFVDATKYNTVVNGLVAGNTYTFHWTINGLAPCDPTSSAVTLIIDKPSAGGTTDGSAVFCAGPNGGVITLSNQVGTVDYWQKSIDNGATWTNVTNTSAALTYSNLTQTTQYRAMVHNGVCGQDPSSVSTITINPLTTIAAAGPNQELCSVTTYTMQGNDPGANNTGLWTVDGSPAGVTFTDATKYNTQVNGLVAGTTYIFRWTITGQAPCLPTSSPVTIIIDQSSDGGVTAGSVAYCAGPNNGQITLSGQVGTVDKWQKSVDNGANWIDIANTTAVLPYSGLTQTTQYRAMVHNGVCAPAPSSVSTVTINPPTVVAVAGPNQELCSVTTYTMQGNDPGINNTGLWTVDGAPAGVTFVDPTKYNTVVNGLIAGTTYTFHWTITGLAPCPPTSDAVTIIIDKPSVGGTTDGAAVFCAGPNGGQVTLSNQVGTVDYWQKSTDNGANWINIPGNTSPILIYSNLAQTTQFRAMVHNGMCGQDPSTPTTITINPVTVTAIAGPNQELCGATTYTMQGNSPGTGTGLWTVDGSPAGVTFSDATLPDAVVNGMVPGNTYTFRWTITGQAPCDPSSSPVTIIIDEPSVGGTTDGSVVFCAGPNGGQINLTGQRGIVDHWEMSTDNGANWANIGNAGLSQAYANLTQTTQYRAMVRNGFCPPVPSSVSTITINPATVTAIAGADQRLCNVTTYTLQGNSPGAGTGLWTVDAGPPPVTFSDATDPHAMVTGMVPGNTYNFHWTITGVAPCPSNSNAVKVIIDQLAIGGTTDGADVVCTGNNRGSITLTGQLGTIVRWEYSTDNGGHWQADNNTNNIYLYSNLTQTTQYRAIVSNGVCGEVQSTPTTIMVGQPAIASVPGPDEAVCNVTSYNLHANNPAPGTGKWTVLLGPPGATFSNDTDPNATVTGLVPGNVYQFEWAITGSAGCPPNKRYVTITDDQPPIGGTTAGATTVCGGNNNGSVTLTGQFGTIVRWESTTNNGASWVKLDNETNILAYSNLTITTTYRALIHKDGKCGDVYSDPTTITVNPPTVAANAGPDDEVCSVTTYKLQGNAAGTGTGKWTVASGPAGATFSNDADPVATVSGLIPGSTYQFQWTITGLPTCAINTDLVAVTIDQAPIGGTTAGAATVCADGNKGDIKLTGQFGTIVRWESSTNNGSTWDAINNNVTDTYSYSGLAQTTQFRAILHIDGKCADAPSTATTITVNPQTVVADAGKDFTICNTSIAKLNGNSPGPSTGLWTQTAGPTVTIANPAAYQTIVSGLAKGNVYTFKWTIKGLAPCVDTYASVTIGAYEDVVPSFTKTEDHICGTSTVTFTNTSTPSPTGTFEWDFGDGTPVVTAVNPPSHTFVPSPDGREMTYKITLTPTSNCELKAPFADYVKISPQKPIAALSPAQLSYCGTFSLSAKNMSPGENSQYDFYLKDAIGTTLQHVRKTDTTTAVFQSITPAAPTTYSVYVVATDKCGNQGNSTPINISAAPSSLVSGVQIKGNVESVCLGSPVTFQNISTGGDRFSISIYDASKKLIVTLPSGTGDLNYTPKALGKYYVSIIAGSTGCGDAPASALREFNVAPTPAPRFTYTADNNYNVTFYNNTPDAGVAPASTIKYKWDFGDGSARDTNYIPATHHYDITRAPFTVTLTATTPGTNCFDVYTNSVELKFHGDLFMPNAFIPTSANRELNTYRVKGFGMKTWHMQIFNNFGQLIWESTKLDANGSPTEGWDGTYKGQIVEQGVYIWQITATLLNGEDWRGVSVNGSTPSKTGPIHLIR
ncbi:PKD-like domain-containing protein [Mucilaginibacter agri]|uniref:PKD domain-containing protein n=1 Tax=Mucilaginibacter agri TaxID=2695265 RepID=A0A966DTN1_9SPHI|nr:PKD-like domain-containing protein [Mucilaginibacter agri]NCD70840.1 hypothetical protein [Mucilaginibacter agri]